eukprot:CAMPEP_0202375080 /NCGR_PEP_ID=MMETSP1127-20130417/5804_1 /ASSEMBLY_ACC=CAM_ASM_000462 /TAXON_ID=3047 /ORGANISM="Dunaliella tertiolecta, Strain CCMP1320" /LENGTH=915 /DNA_ID=CAMNT_0048972435 /DNA_START=30 /DNA_END=2774 /DNA_ORIENTATION=-
MNVACPMEDLPKQPSNKPESKAKLAIAKAIRSVEFFSRHKAKQNKKNLKATVQKPSPQPSTEVSDAQIDESVLNTIDDVEASLSELRSLSAAAKSFSVPTSKHRVAGFLVSPSLTSFTDEELAQRTHSESAARESWHAQRKLLLQQLPQQQQQQEAPVQYRRGRIVRKGSQTHLLPSIDTASAASLTTSQAASTPRGRSKATLAQQQRPGTSSPQLQLRHDPSSFSLRESVSVQLPPEQSLGAHNSSSGAKHHSGPLPKTKGDAPPHRPFYLHFSTEEPSILGPVSSPSPTVPGSLAASLISPRASVNALSTTTANTATDTTPAPATMPPMPMPFGISLPSVFSTSTNTSTSSVSTPPQALKHSSPTSLSTPQCCVHPLRPHPPTTDAPLSPRPVRELDEGSRLQPTDAKGLQSKRLTAGFESSNPATAAFSEAQLQGTATRDSGPAPAPPATRGRFMFATQASTNRSEGPISRSGSQKKRSVSRSGSSKRERSLRRSSSSKREPTLNRSGSFKKESRSLSTSGFSRRGRSLARNGSFNKRQGVKLRGTDMRRDPSTRSLLSGKSGSGRRRVSESDGSEPERSTPSRSASQKSQRFSLSRGSTQLTESLDTAEDSMSNSSANDTFTDLLSPRMFFEPVQPPLAGLPSSPRIHRPPRHTASAHLLYQAVGSSEGGQGGDALDRVPGLTTCRPALKAASSKSAPRKQHSTPNLKQARFNLPAMPQAITSPQVGLSFCSPRPPEVPPPPSVAEPPPSSSGKLVKQAGSLRQFLAGQRVDVDRLEPDTYLLMLDVESKGRAHTLGRFAGQSRPKSKSSFGLASAPSLSRAGMPSIAADGPNEEPLEHSDVLGDGGGECRDGKAQGSLPAQGRAGNSLSSMLAQFEDEERELRMLHDRARSSLAPKSREHGFSAELRPHW